MSYFNHYKTEKEFQEYLDLKHELDNSIFYKIDKSLSFTADDFTPGLVTQEELDKFHDKVRPKINRYNFLKTHYGYNELLAKLKKSRKASGYRRQEAYEYYIREEDVKNNLSLLCNVLNNLKIIIPPKETLVEIQKTPEILNDLFRLNGVKLLKKCELGFINEASNAVSIIYDLWRFHGYTLPEEYAKDLLETVKEDKKLFDLAESLQKAHGKEYDEGDI